MATEERCGFGKLDLVFVVCKVVALPEVCLQPLGSLPAWIVLRDSRNVFMLSQLRQLLFRAWFLTEKLLMLKPACASELCTYGRFCARARCCRTARMRWRGARHFLGASDLAAAAVTLNILPVVSQRAERVDCVWAGFRSVAPFGRCLGSYCWKRPSVHAVTEPPGGATHRFQSAFLKGLEPH
ncbi:uncharacterized protein V6R79_009984 [Siganus canaliculatus]